MKLLMLFSLFLGGCVHRSLRIESDPTGADVRLDGKSMGKTPLETEFTWYGDREIILEMRGYHSRIILQPVSPPWWQIIPLDFITEALLPIPLEDRRVFRYELTPFQEGQEAIEAIKERASQLKIKAHED